VFSGSPALGYIVVGLLGIALGAGVAVVTYRLGRAPDLERGSDEEGRGA